MSGCEYYQELISRMLDEQLSGEESAVLAEHLTGCEDCRKMHSAFTALSEAIAEDMVDAPESIRINVMAEVRRSELLKKNSRKTVKRLFAAAACLVLVAGTAYMALPRLAEDNLIAEPAVVMAAAPAEVAENASAPVAEEAAPIADTAAEAPAAKAAGTQSAASAVSTESSIPQENALFGLFTRSKLADGENSIDLNQLMAAWDEISAVLKGVPAELSPEDLEGEPGFTLNFMYNNEMHTISLIYSDGVLYYTDPFDGEFKQASCSKEDLVSFLT